MGETITIKRGGVSVCDAPLTKECTRRYELMTEDSVTLRFSTGYDDVPMFEIGDYVEYDGETFVLKEQPAPTYNASNGGYDFNLVFVAEYMAWSNVLMKSVRAGADGARMFGETEWYYTATLLEHACAVLRCVYLHDGVVKAGDELMELVDIDYGYICNADERKHVSYSGTDVLSAINDLCSAERYGCEWWVTREDGEYMLHFGRLARDAESTREIRQGVDGVITREQSQRKYANRLYVYGGTQNVPYSYRKSLVFNNTRKDGNLGDERRVLEPEMVEGAERVPEYRYMERYAASYSSYGIHAVKERVYIVARDHGDHYGPLSIEAGEYCVHLSQIYYKAETADGEDSGYDIFDGSQLTLCYQLDGGDIERRRVEYSARRNSLRATLGEDLYISTHQSATLCVWLEVNLSFVVITGFLYTYCDSTWQEGPQDAVMDRLDRYETGVTVYDMALGVEFDGRWVRTALGEWIEPDMSVQTTEYEVLDVISTSVPDHYFTADNEDIINGITEMRLLLPKGPRTTSEGFVLNGGYIETTDVAEGRTAAVEASVAHDEIYPMASMSVTDVDDSETRTATVTYGDGTTSEQDYKVYRVFAKMTNGLEGDERREYDFKESYLLKDVSNKLRVKFTEGDLAGMEFEALLEEDTQSYLIVPNNDYGAQLPNERLHPRIGDEMILLGWNPKAMGSLGLIGASEERLLIAAEKDIKEYSEGVYTYKVEMTPNTSDAFALLVDKDGETLTDSDGELLCSDDVDEEPTMPAGSAVTLADSSMFKGGRSGPLRVIGYEKSMDINWDSPRYTIGEIPQPTRTQRIKKTETETHELKIKLQRK